MDQDDYFVCGVSFIVGIATYLLTNCWFFTYHNLKQIRDDAAWARSYSLQTQRRLKQIDQQLEYITETVEAIEDVLLDTLDDDMSQSGCEGGSECGCGCESDMTQSDQSEYSDEPLDDFEFSDTYTESESDTEPPIIPNYYE